MAKRGRGNGEDEPEFDDERDALGHGHEKPEGKGEVSVEQFYLQYPKGSKVTVMRKGGSFEAGWKVAHDASGAICVQRPAASGEKGKVDQKFLDPTVLVAWQKETPTSFVPEQTTDVSEAPKVTEPAPNAIPPVSEVPETSDDAPKTPEASAAADYWDPAQSPQPHVGQRVYVTSGGKNPSVDEMTVLETSPYQTTVQDAAGRSHSIATDTLAGNARDIDKIRDFLAKRATQPGDETETVSPVAAEATSDIPVPTDAPKIDAPEVPKATEVADRGELDLLESYAVGDMVDLGRANDEKGWEIWAIDPEAMSGSTNVPLRLRKVPHGAKPGTPPRTIDAPLKAVKKLQKNGLATSVPEVHATPEPTPDVPKGPEDDEQHEPHGFEDDLADLDGLQKRLQAGTLEEFTAYTNRLDAAYTGKSIPGPDYRAIGDILRSVDVRSLRSEPQDSDQKDNNDEHTFRPVDEMKDDELNAELKDLFDRFPRVGRPTAVQTRINEIIQTIRSRAGSKDKSDDEDDDEQEDEPLTLSQFTEELDDPEAQKGLLEGNASNIDTYEEELDAVLDTLDTDDVAGRTEHARLKAILANIRQQREQGAQTPPSTTSTEVQNGNPVTRFFKKLFGGKKPVPPVATPSADGTTPPAGPEVVAPAERPEPTPVDVPLADAQREYAKALRSQVKLVLGRSSNEQLDQLRVNYEFALGKENASVLEELKKEFAGRDMTDATVREEFASKAVAKVLETRLREELAMRAEMQTEAQKTLFAKWRKKMGESAWQRLAVSGTVFTIGFVLPQLRHGLREIASPLTAAGSGSMTEAVWTLIETNNFATKKYSSDEIKGMTEERLIALQAAHEWKHARLLTGSFGNSRTLGMKFWKQYHDTTGESIAAQLTKLREQKAKTELEAILTDAGGDPDKAILDLMKRYAGRSEELSAFRSRSGTERKLQAGKTATSWGVGLTMGYFAGMLDLGKDIGHVGRGALDRLHITHPSAVQGLPTDHPASTGVPGTHGESHPGSVAPGANPTSLTEHTTQGEYLHNRPGVPVDENAPGNMGYPVDGHGLGHAASADHTDLYTGQDADATIRAKEGIEHALRRQLDHFAVAQQHGYTGPDDPHAIHAWSAGEAQRIAEANHFIDAKAGTEQWVHTPGTQVHLNPDGSVSVDHPSDLYTHAPYHPHEAGAGHVDTQPHIDQQNVGVPEHTDIAPTGINPQDALHDALRAEHMQSLGVEPDASQYDGGGVTIGPDYYTTDFGQHAGNVADVATVKSATAEIAARKAEALANTSNAGSASDHGSNLAAGIDHGTAHEAAATVAGSESILHHSKATSDAIDLLRESQKQALGATEIVTGNHIKEAHALYQVADNMKLSDIVTGDTIYETFKKSVELDRFGTALHTMSRALYDLKESLHDWGFGPNETVGDVMKLVNAAEQHH